MTAAAARAVSIVTAEGGYVSGEQAAVNPQDPARSTVSLQLKIPVAVYAGTLSTLSTALGTQTSLTQHAQDVTEEVADVSSLVSSAQAAITQLQALLQRAGRSASSSPSSSRSAAKNPRSRRCRRSSARCRGRPATRPCPCCCSARGRGRGLPGRRPRSGSTGSWRGSPPAGAGCAWLSPACSPWLGAVLPFAVIAAVAAGAGYAGRRRLMRLLRRGSAAEDRRVGLASSAAGPTPCAPARQAGRACRDRFRAAHRGRG